MARTSKLRKKEPTWSQSRKKLGRQRNECLKTQRHSRLLSGPDITASSPMPIGPAISHWPAGFSAYPTQLRRAARATAPKIVTKTPNGTPALAAAAGWSSLRSSNPGARRNATPRFQIRSTAHDRHRPLTTLQCCSHLSLVVDRQRACSADDRSRAPAHSCGDGDRNSFVASPGPATASSGSRPHLAVTTPTSQPIARRSQIPIAPARRTVVRMPARGFLPRGLSDACPPSAPHCQVTARRLITLNDSGPSYRRARPRRG